MKVSNLLIYFKKYSGIYKLADALSKVCSTILN